MSSRFLKKVSETYGNKLNIPEVCQESELSDDDNVTIQINKFNLLQIETESDEENIDDGEQKQEINSVSEKRSKIKKVKSKKYNKKSQFKDMTEDEILEQFSNESANKASLQKSKVVNDSLFVKIRNLNEEIELQHMFGSSVANTNQNRSNDHSRRSTVLKCTFGKRNPDWPPLSLSKLGLKMERASSAEDNNWCIVTCTDQYLLGERALKTAMRTGSYQDLLRDWPYHINSLLQTAAVLINQEDFTMAADLLKRIFHVYETISPMGLSLIGCGGGGVGGALTRGNCHLDYRYRLNRGIFLALFQWVLYLCQRSCFTTALEYCKVLLNLNVGHDPLAMILLIDDLALRARLPTFLLAFHEQHLTSKGLPRLPNYAYSIPFCLHLHGNDPAEADRLLQLALVRFPSFLTALLSAASLRPDDRLARASLFTADDDPPSLAVLIGLYVRRSLNLWREPPVIRWLQDNVNAVLDRLETEAGRVEAHRERDSVKAVYGRAVPLAVRRHVLLSGHGALLAGLGGAPDPPLAFDPFPPIDGEGGLDHHGDIDQTEALEDSWLTNLLRSLMPSFR